MDLKDINKKRVMHVDISRRFKQKGDTGIAFKMIKTNEHKGMGLNNKLKRELDRDLSANEDYARLSAICVFCLIKDCLNEFDVLIICNDEPFIYVKEYLDILFRENDIYLKKEISSLAKLREIMGDNKLRSYAHNIANTYRRKVFLSIQRQQRGIPLNIVKINYKCIVKKWEEIQENMK